jgi:hypothetical protein
VEIRSPTHVSADCAHRVASPRHPGGGSPKRLLQAASALALAVVFATRCDSTGSAKTLEGRRPAARLDGTGFYASPTGSRSAGGSLADPWDLQTAFGRPLPPGSTLWLRGGTYSKTFTCKLAGTASARITIRPYPGERVTFDSHDPANVNVSLITTPAAAFLDFWDLEFMVSNVNRQNNGVPGATSGPAPGGNGAENTLGHDLRFIHPVVHDTTGGWGMNQDTAYNNETYGLISYYNGWWGIDRPHGHNLYMHNQTGYKKAANSILFDSFAEGNHVYTSSGYANGIIEDGIITFDSGRINLAQPQRSGTAAPLAGYPPDTPKKLIGAYGRAANSLCGSGNVTGSGSFNRMYEFVSNPAPSSFHFANGFNPLTLTNGYFGNGGTPGEVCQGPGHPPPHGSTSTISGNTFIGSSTYYAGAGLWAVDFPDNSFVDSHTAPAANVVFTLPDAYTRGRGHVAIYNWQRLTAVPVDISAFGLAEGQAFTVQHAMDFYGAPVVSGTYRGAAVLFPMTNLPIAQPINAVKPVGPFPRFAAFVVLPGSDRSKSQERPQSPAELSPGS